MKLFFVSVRILYIRKDGQEGESPVKNPGQFCISPDSARSNVRLSF